MIFVSEKHAIKNTDMKYFTIEELSRSATAVRLGIDNRATPEAIENMKQLVEHLLDPLRELWGAPLMVTSGYRCLALNSAVGGVANSHHLRGMAADLVTMSNRVSENRRLMDVLVGSGLRWTQAIWECNRRGATWVHVSYDRANLGGEVLSRMG